LAVIVTVLLAAAIGVVAVPQLFGGAKARSPHRPHPLTAPTGVRAGVGCSGLLEATVTLRWVPTRQKDAEGYVVYWRESVDEPFQRLARVDDRATDRFVDTTAPLGSDQTYVVKTQAGRRLSAASTPVTVHVPGFCF